MSVLKVVPDIRIEALGDDVLRLYDASGMDRGLLGREAIEWVFAGNGAPFAVARLDDEIVGLSAYIQGRWKTGLGSGTGIAYQAVDSFVSERMRGRGLFTELAKVYAAHAAASGADLIWGFPNDNAAPVWFGRLGWSNEGQVPLMIKPLRASYFLRKARLPLDFPLNWDRDQNIPLTETLGDWADELWERLSLEIPCAIVRDRAWLEHRLFCSPHDYRVVAEPLGSGALVATREANKHGGHIAYLMEAIGEGPLEGLLRSELARLRDRGVELVLAWCYPWSPNYQVLRRCGFFRIAERLRPVRIWFGAKACSPAGARGESRQNWYLSYLESDTV